MNNRSCVSYYDQTHSTRDHCYWKYNISENINTPNNQGEIISTKQSSVYSQMKEFLESLTSRIPRSNRYTSQTTPSVFIPKASSVVVVFNQDTIPPFRLKKILFYKRQLKMSSLKDLSCKCSRFLPPVCKV